MDAPRSNISYYKAELKIWLLFLISANSFDCGDRDNPGIDHFADERLIDIVDF